MNRPDYIPADYDRIEVVESLSDLFDTPLRPPVNVILYPRSVSGDFNALAFALLEKKRLGVTTGFCRELYEKDFEKLRRSLKDEKALQAASVVLNDLKETRKSFGTDLSISVRLVQPQGYNKSEMVYSFHGDATGKQGRIICCYNEPVTEGARNEDVVEAVDKKEQYELRLEASPFRFRVGDVWKQAGKMTAPGLPPFIHRAPAVRPDDPPRLLLVAG